MLAIPNFHHVKQALIFSLLILMSLNVYAEQVHDFEGRAFDPQTSALLYIETHQVILNDAGDYLSAYVTYSYPNGDLFAEKRLDYTKNALAPDLMFYDKRSSERTSVSLSPRGDYLKVLIENDKTRSESTVNLEGSLLVVDAGFDRLIESRWSSLRKDKELQFSFLAITRSQLINFEVNEVKESEASVFLELHPRNFFIDLLVDPIDLEYDINNKHLLSFEGLTNIEIFIDGKRTEKNYVARIDYSYQPIKAK